MRFSTLAYAVSLLSAGGVLASTCLIASSIVLSNPDHQWAFAYYGSPLWHFPGIKNNGQTYRICYPFWPRRPDGSKRAAVAHPGGMNALGNGCGNQPTADGWGPNFPTFYTVKQCSNNEVRVSYNLFYEKDGESIYGHDYDWEYVVIVWRKVNSGGTDLYCKNELILSQHSGRQTIKPWSNVKQTVDINNWYEANAKDKDIPKIYPGICKHAMYQEAAENQQRDPTGLPVIGACIGNDFRNAANFGVSNQKANLIRSGYDTDYGQFFINNNWGSASSKPTNVWNDMCGYSPVSKRGVENVPAVEGNYTLGVTDEVTGLNLTTFVFDTMEILE